MFVYGAAEVFRYNTGFNFVPEFKDRNNFSYRMCFTRLVTLVQCGIFWEMSSARGSHTMGCMVSYIDCNLEDE